jgi:undecaprenyl phosphate-alpha-L-ara4N flippase subunit ArnE
MKPLNLLLVLCTNIFFAASSVFFKMAIDKAGKIDLTSLRALLPAAGRFLSSPLFVAGVLAAVVGSAGYYLMLARLNLSIAYPLLSLAYIFVALASVLFLRETITLPNWIGILLICAGVALISIRPH